MTIAQVLFQNRDSTDCTKFHSWYHNEDVQRLIWNDFIHIPPDDRATMMDPFVFFDGIGDTWNLTFDRLMTLCREKLESSTDSQHSYFPFIFKPETGGAHYMAGIVRKDKDQTRFFLFNPLGYEKTYAQKRLGLSSSDSTGGMKLILSPHAVQQKEKEDGPLVSCGPLCVEFLKYAMHHPDWVASLDERFVLPAHLQELVNMEKAEYQEKMIAFRHMHKEELGQISDEQLDDAPDFFAPVTEHFIEAIHTGRQLIENETFSVRDSFSEMGSSFDEEVDYEYLDFDALSSFSEMDSSFEEEEDKDLPFDASPLINKALDQPAIKQAQERYNDYVTQFKRKTQQLIDKGTKEHIHYNPAYTRVGDIAKTFNTRLDKAGEIFFRNPSAESLKGFKQNVENAIRDASEEFKKHRGVWHTLHPLIKGILGVLATLTVIPALIVATTAQGYTHTFFKTPPTDTEKQMQRFEEQLNSPENGTFIIMEQAIKC